VVGASMGLVTPHIKLHDWRPTNLGSGFRLNTSQEQIQFFITGTKKQVFHQQKKILSSNHGYS
jgi:N6-adenosine-specific RNA methylase IME4